MASVDVRSWCALCSVHLEMAAKGSIWAHIV